MTILLLTPRDWYTLASLFVTSLAYTALLELWWRHYPQSYANLTWFQVVIGNGYVLVALAFMFPPYASLAPLDYWLRACAAFFVASLPIIARSVVVHSVNQRDAEGVARDREG